MDDSVPEAHLALGAALFFNRWDWEGCDRELSRAIQLNPAFAEAYHFRAKVYDFRDQHQNAIDAEKKGAELAPFERPWAVSQAYINARRYDEAINDLRQKIEATPQDSALHWLLSEAYRRKGDETEAEQELEKMTLIDDRDQRETVHRAFAHGGYRKLKIGTVVDLPLRRDAEKAVLALRAKINSGIRSPETVNDLIAHYSRLELTPERKSFSTIENHNILCKLYIGPKWGACKLSAVRTVQVEEWLDSLPLSPGSKTKIKSTFSVLYSHAIRYGWLALNPISKVRTSSARVREKDILTPEEFQRLVAQLSVRDKAIVLLVGSSAVRRSELFALPWSRVDMERMEVHVTQSCVRNHFGKPKTDASRRTVVLHPLVLDALLAWRRESLYPGDEDFLFPSIRLNGTKPLSPDSLLKKSIRPALVRAGIVAKTIGYHSFRHAVSTYMSALKIDVKTASASLGHASVRFTLDRYTRSATEQKRDATNQLMDLLLPSAPLPVEHPSAPSAL